MKLLTTDKLSKRFKENLSWATEVDIATAWTGINESLNELVRKKESQELKVRAMAGIRGTITDPNALKQFFLIGKLCLVDNTSLYHPKVYIFRNGRKTIAWVGSANFTSPGFGHSHISNEETILETTDTKDIQTWFDKRWKKCTLATLEDIEKYRLEWARKRRSETDAEKTKRKQEYLSLVTKNRDLDRFQINTHPVKLYVPGMTWEAYLTKLRISDTWWPSLWDFSVLGETDSWYYAIKVLGNLIRRDWDTLDDMDEKKLLGLPSGDSEDKNWALLGTMRGKGSAQKTIFGEDNRNRVEDIIKSVISTDDADVEFIDVAIKAYKELYEIKDVGVGIASRLLTLARPDRFVSVNGASSIYLGKLFELPHSTLGTVKNYRELLTKIYEEEWMKAEPPENSHERDIWSMRLALIDCFVYNRNGK